MLKLKKLYALVAALMVATMLVACGDNTATTAPTTAAATTAAATTAAATTAAKTTAAATTAAATTAAATTAAATTAAATTAAATTAAATTAAATTAASGTGNVAVDANGVEAYQPYPTAAPTGGKLGGNLNWVSLAAQLASTLHPWPAASDFTNSVTDVEAYLYGTTLLDLDAFTNNFRYGAAQSLTISPDNKTYTFTLRDGLKWSDGSAITADDYVYPFNEALKEDKSNPDNNYVGLDSIKNVASFTNPDAKTVVCTTKDVLAKNLALAYCVSGFPVKKSVWSQYPFYDVQKNPEILKPTVTSGPYTLKEYKLDEKIVLQANPNYYKGKPNFDTLTLLPAAQPTNAYESVKAGQNQYASNISASQYNDAKSNSNVGFYEWGAGNGTYRQIEFNTTRAPFQDKTMRQAIAYAIDKSALLKAADSGVGTVIDSFIPPNVPQFFNPNVTKYAYSLDKAKQVLKDAGYNLSGDTLQDKSGKPVSFTVVFPTSSNPRKLMAQYLQQQMKQLGMTVNVDGQEFNAYVKKVQAGDFDVSLAAYGGGTPIDPDNNKGIYKSKSAGGSQNVTGYSNPTADQLWDQGVKETDPAKRKEIYNQLQKIYSDDVPDIFLYILNSYSVTTKNIVGPKPPITTNLHDDEAIANRWAYAG